MEAQNTNHKCSTHNESSDEEPPGLEVECSNYQIWDESLTGSDMELDSGPPFLNHHSAEIPIKEIEYLKCRKQFQQLDKKNNNACSIDANLGHDKSRNNTIIKRAVGNANLNEDHNQLSAISPNTVTKFDFMGDWSHFEKNKHPSIQEMCKISEETGERYDKVFHRFHEFRLLTGVRCPSNDNCERVLKYFNQHTEYNVSSIEKKVSMLHDHFKRFGRLGPVLCTGDVHQIVDNVHLPPYIVREYYFDWYIKLQKGSPDLKDLITEEQKIFNREKQERDFAKAVTVDHDYVKDKIPNDCVSRSLLRIIKKKPDLSVADAAILSRLYKIDIGYIHKLVQEDEDVMFTVQHSANNVYINENCIRIEKKPEVIHVSSSINTQSFGLEREETKFNSSFSNQSYTSIDQFDGSDMVVSHYEDVVDTGPFGHDGAVHSSIIEKSGVRDENEYAVLFSGNRLPKDLYQFEKNRHPSIEEMIDSSKEIGITYRQVFFRFQEFRRVLKEHCPDRCICRKVLKLFSCKTVFDGVLDANSVNLMYALFDKYGYVGRSPNIGYIHMIAEKVDLPVFVVRDQYKEWTMDTSLLDSLDMYSEVKLICKNLEKEFRKELELPYERLVHLAKEYNTSQKLILNFYESHFETFAESHNKSTESSKEQESDQPDALYMHNSDYPSVADDSGISDNKLAKLGENRNLVLFSEANEHGSHRTSPEVKKEDTQLMKNCFYMIPGGLVRNLFRCKTNSSYSTVSPENRVRKAKKLKFNMRKLSVSSEYSFDPKRTKFTLSVPDTPRWIPQKEIEDEEIDVVGVDESVIETPIDELSRSFVQCSSNIREFPGDLEAFEKNRHPSIQSMIEISQTLGVTYEDVFFRFQNLRKLKNEYCPPGDTCMKVEIFNQIYPTLNGVLNEQSLSIMHKEFAKLSHFGASLPVGYIHSIMEKVELPSRVIRMQYTEWLTKMEEEQKKVEPAQPQQGDNTAPVTVKNDLASLKQMHESIEIT